MHLSVYTLNNGHNYVTHCLQWPVFNYYLHVRTHVQFQHNLLNIIIIIHSCHSLWGIGLQWNAPSGSCWWPVFSFHSMLSQPLRLLLSYFSSGPDLSIGYIGARLGARTTKKNSNNSKLIKLFQLLYVYLKDFNQISALKRDFQG